MELWVLNLTLTSKHPHNYFLDNHNYPVSPYLMAITVLGTTSLSKPTWYKSGWCNNWVILKCKIIFILAVFLQHAKYLNNQSKLLSCMSDNNMLESSENIDDFNFMKRLQKQYLESDTIRDLITQLKYVYLLFKFISNLKKIGKYKYYSY